MSDTVTAPPAPADGLFVAPFHRTLPRLLRNPLDGFAAIGADSGGRVTRIGLGPFRPYLVTEPEHAQRVLRDHADNYPRGGMIWDGVRRLQGNEGLTSEGEGWEHRRRLLTPLFAARHVNTLVGRMATAIDETADELAPHAGGPPIDGGAAMSRLVYRVFVRTMMGIDISDDQAAALARAVATAFASTGARMVLPFMPERVPLPGDRAFRNAVRTVDDIILPVVRAARAAAAGGRDVVSLLTGATGPDGGPLTDQQVRDDLVAMCVAGTETTAVSLTWLWVLLEGRPEVADRLRAEIDTVVGAGAPTVAMVGELRYARMVIHEVMRLYPAGWVIPRVAAADDEMGGARIPAGAIVMVSPYLTQRSPRHWDRPDEFDPDRFAPGRDRGRHPFAYFPFGGGPHSCLGRHFFTMEAQLAMVAMLHRFRTRVPGAASVRGAGALALRPAGRVDLMLEPR